VTTTRRPASAIEIVPEPTAADLEGLMKSLERGWTATLTVRRQAPDDIGYREVYVRLDGRRVAMLSYGATLTEDIEPGRHVLQVDNTLFKKTLEFTASVGEHVAFSTANRAGWGTYSAWALLIGFLGAGPFYITLERDRAPDESSRDSGPA
jgi:hypothetical protein